MSTTNHTFKQQITDCNACLDQTLRTRYGMGIKAYKLVKAVTQLTGVLGVIYAMTLGMDPGTAALIIGGIVAGPEAFEYVIMQGNTDSSSSERRSSE